MMIRETVLGRALKSLTQLASKRTAFSLLLFGCIFSTTSMANPDNPTVVAGSASFEELGNQLNITNSPGTIINWNGFSINRNEITQFLQQNNQSAVLNRVTGGSISSILGELTSNGRVFVVNPNGIVIGNGARIDTAGFVGSSLDITDQDFLNGRYTFKGDGGAVINNGTITAGPDGEIILIAPSVENNGDISVVGGEIILAAGREVTLTSLNDANISFRVSAPGDRALNIGSMTANNGAIGVFANQVSAAGNISANRVTTNARGQIVLQADGNTEVSGVVTATGSDVPGGDITILGDNIQLVSAHIDATGTNGGQVLVGGEFQGEGSLQRATRTDIDQGSVIHADALQRGNGGEIIVWSEQATNSQGRLTARGGSVSGDGGLVETSSRGNLQFGQPADVSATNGSPGTWLLDPEDIVIDSAHADSISTALNGGSNVEVRTADTGTGEGNIAVNAPIRKTEGPDAALGLIAHNRIDVNAPIESVSGRLSVSLRAGRDISVNAPINTNGGSYSANIVPSLLPAEADTEEDSEGSSSADEETIDISEASTTDDTESNNVEPSDEVELPVTDITESIEDTAAAEAIVPDTLNEVENNSANLVNSVDVEPAVIAEPTTAATPPAAITPHSSGISIDAAVDTAGGDIEINAGASGLLSINQSVVASGDTAGNVKLLGDQIALYDQAVVDASSTNGGGEILIGGDQQGFNPEVPNSDAVYIAETASVSADGLDQSDGGRVIIYAESVANIDGDISARGGDNGGDGGFVETSGRDYLRVSKVPDVSAANGKGGTWLIDPSEINIADTDTSNIDENIIPAGTEFTTTSGNDSSTLSITQLATALAMGTDVQVVTSAEGTGFGDINFLAPLSTDFGATTGFDTGSLTLSAHNDINIFDSITNSFLPENQLESLTLIANSDGVGGGDVNISTVGLGIRLDINTRGDLTISADNLNITSDFDENIFINAGGDFQFDIADTITLIGGDSFSTVSLRSDGFSGDSNIQAQNLTLSGIGTGRSSIGGLTTIDIEDTVTLASRGNLFVEEVNTENLISGNFANIGAGTLNTSGLTTIDGQLAFSGVWNIADGAVVNWNSGNIISTGGEINNAGTFNANGDDRLVISNSDTGSVDLNFNNSGRFAKTDACEPTCGETTLEGAGIFGGDLTFNNSGELEIEAGDLVFVQLESSGVFSGGFNQSAGSTTLSGGNLIATAEQGNTDVFVPGLLEFTGGTIQGGVNNTDITAGGNITGNTTVDGTTIAAGFSPGTLNFNGNLTVGNTSNIAIELANTAAGNFDVINVTGTATLNDPTIDVTFLGYAPPTVAGVTDNFDVINAQNLVLAPNAAALVPNQPGTISPNTLVGFGQRGNTFFLSYGFDGQVVVVPETPPEIPPGTPPGEFPTFPGNPVITPGTPVFIPGTNVPFVPVTTGNETPNGRLGLDPTFPIISLVSQIPGLETINESPKFLQCY